MIRAHSPRFLRGRTISRIRENMKVTRTSSSLLRRRRFARFTSVAVALNFALFVCHPNVAAGDNSRGGIEWTTERPDDPPGAIVGPRATSPRAVITFGPYTSYQVNVDAIGNNLIGDAANEPSIAIDPTAPNRMAGGWRQFDTITSNFREAGVAHSIDGGRTWSASAVLEDGVFRSDPVLAAAPDGTLYYLSLSVNVFNEFLCDVFISTDGGATWPQKHFALGGDKAWLVVDPINSHLYQPWNTAGNVFFPAQFSRSTDGGVNWDTPIIYDPFGNPPARPVFGTLDTGPSGEVYVAGVQNALPSSNFWAVRSTNAADPMQTASFDLIRTINMGGQVTIGGAPNPGGLLGQINVGVDTSGGPFNGTVYVLCSVDPVGTDPLAIHIIRSFDGGDTWSIPTRVNDDPNGTNAWQWFGAMDVAPNGRIDVVWNDTRNTGQSNMSQLYYSFSTDAGVTWAVNVPLSPVFNSHLGWPNQNKLGDYYHVVSDLVGAHVIYAATFNSEQDVYYLRIGDYDCNNNGVGDADDIANKTSFDCNENGLLDECEIAAGAVADTNQNAVPDSCQPCLVDITDNGTTNLPDGVVNVFDLFALLSEWNTNGPGAEIAAPPTLVDVLDLFALLSAWGKCGP